MVCHFMDNPQYSVQRNRAFLCLLFLLRVKLSQRNSCGFTILVEKVTTTTLSGRDSILPGSNGESISSQSKSCFSIYKENVVIGGLHFFHWRRERKLPTGNGKRHGVFPDGSSVFLSLGRSYRIPGGRTSSGGLAERN
ncbi:hypothetical protein CDAR_24331 [Caerostris darwini]|uniref:Uncharacterized protein n=1 Tax=Caerostris darwini TaxID=1538125 RepID=A0AAV4QIU4_9ARAC|nr:hypothetical protein CDAR_24331 [Caerostris darwini]